MKEYLIEDEPTFKGRYKEGFATDFLVDRGIEFIESAVNNDQPFALVISIPDPHGKSTYKLCFCHNLQSIFVHLLIIHCYS